MIDMDGQQIQGRIEHGKVILLMHTLSMRENDVASLVEFRPVV